MKNTILFDLFGTLAPSPPKAAYREVVDGIASIARLPADQFFDKWMSVNDGRLNGAFGSSEGDIAHVVRMFGRSLSSEQMSECVRIRRDAMTSWIAPKPGALETLEELDSMGFRLGLVSDCVFDVPAVWAKSRLANILPVAVFSCQLKVRKPDPRIYNAALSILGVPPQQALFVGDGGSNELAGAQAVGMTALMLDDQAKNQADVLRVDVHEWGGPAVSHISGVIQAAQTLSSEGQDVSKRDGR